MAFGYQTLFGYQIEITDFFFVYFQNFKTEPNSIKIKIIKSNLIRLFRFGDRINRIFKKKYFLCKKTLFYYKQIWLKKFHIVYLYIYTYHIYLYIYIIYIYIYSKKIRFFRLTELTFAKTEIRTEKIE